MLVPHNETLATHKQLLAARKFQVSTRGPYRAARLLQSRYTGKAGKPNDSRHLGHLWQLSS